MAGIPDRLDFRQQGVPAPSLTQPRLMTISISAAPLATASAASQHLTAVVL